MNGNYIETHEKILSIGKEMFLQFGFKQTNLRDLCAKAGVTTGAFYRHFNDKEALFNALVEPTINKMEQIFFSRTNKFKGSLSGKEQYGFIDYSAESSNYAIDFIYANLDVFKLLVGSSEGTKYEDFVEYVTNLENGAVSGAYDDVEKAGWDISDIDDNIVHMITHAFFSCLFEVVVHDYKKEEALKYAEKIGRYFAAGWSGLIRKGLR